MNEMDLDFAASAKPFASVVLCCTGVDHEERTVLVNHAQQMGAVFKADLRSDITHLIVGNVDTPKYEYAAHSRFDLKIMDLKWVEKAYERWIQGEDVNLEDTVAAHILPPLYGLHICLTNIASQEDRKLIESQINSHGGTYHPDLSRQCTHLLCASASGKKYEAALKWGLNCVGVEWLFQSIERGMALDPKYYSLDIEPHKRGEGAWDRNAMLRASGLSGMATDKVVPMEFEGGGGRKRRLRRAGSKMAQEVWDGILGGVVEQAHENAPVRTAEDVAMQSLHIADNAPAEGFGMTFHDSNGLFEGMIFYTWGFNDKQREALTNVITKNAGLVFTKPLPGVVNDARSFTVIPYKCPREEAPTGYAGSEVVTQMWIERCLVANIALDPSSIIMCKPMPGPFPRPYLRNVAFCITGFSGPDLLHVEQLIVLMGGDYYPNLTRKRSLLLTTDNQLGGPKLTRAKEWGIPVVNIGWFWNVIARPEEADHSPWCDTLVAELVRYTPEEACSGLRSAPATNATAAQPIPTKESITLVLNGTEKSTTTTAEQKREKRPRQDENISPNPEANQSTEAKLDHITKLLTTVCSPQKKSKRKLAGRARNTQTTHSSVTSPEDTFSPDEDIPRATQEKVEYKDPVAEREMAKIVANLQGISEEKKVARAQEKKSEMTPAEDIGRRGGRRKSGRK